MNDIVIRLLQTGYFAHPERPEAEFPPVHAIRDGSLVPVCGVEIPEDFEYQWCARTLWMPYVDCGRCQRLIHEAAISQGILREDRLPQVKAAKLFKSWGNLGG
jgi:hypothetical protein